MKKAVLSFSILIWGALAALSAVILVFYFFDIPAPGWVRTFPGYQSGWNWKGGGNMTLIMEESFPVDGVRDIRVGGGEYAVIVTLHEGRDLEVRQYGREGSRGLEVTADGTVIDIGVPKWTFSLFGWGGSPRLEIMIPRAYAQDISLTGVSGSVTVTGAAVWKNVRIKTTSGSIRLNDDLTANDADISSVSGSIRLEGTVRCDSLSVRTTSGAVSLAGFDAPGSVHLKSVSGSVRAGNLKGTEITCETTSGSVTAGDCEASGTVRLTSTSGSVKAGDILSPQYYIKTTSGGINVGTLSGTGEIKSTSGRVRTGE